MPEADIAIGPLAGQDGLEYPAVSLRVLPPAARFSLRCRADDSAARDGLAKMGIALPAAVAGVAPFDDGGRVMWLGPDEWRVVAPADGQGALVDRFADALVGTDAVAVDVSHAFAGLRLEGPGAADVLAAGCALDLHDSVFSVGTCARSRLAKVNVVLYRPAKTTFDVEVVRSVARYAFDWLAAAARELLGPAAP